MTPYTSENKGTYRNCENVVGFGRHKPKWKIVHSGHLIDPIVEKWPTHRIIKNSNKKFRKLIFVAKFICMYKIKIKGTLK
jgi:hypothetical protein